MVFYTLYYKSIKNLKVYYEYGEKTLNNLLDDKTLKSNLIFSAMFIALYENFITLWEDSIRDFFADGYDFSTGEIIYTYSEYAKAKLKKELSFIRKNNNDVDKLLSIFNFMVKCNVIDLKDYEDLKLIRERRCSLVHDLTVHLEKGIEENDKELFRKLKNISEKADRNWFYEFELAIGGEEMLGPNGEVPEYVISSRTAILNTMIDLAIGKEK